MKRNEYPGELVFFSAVAGAAIAPLKLLVHHIFVWTGLAKGFYSMLTAYLTHGHHETKGITDWIFSEFGDLAIGALFAVILGYWLRASRPRYHWWIGISFGFGIWFASLVFGNLTKIIKTEMTDPWSLFAHLLAMMIYGLLFVLASKYWTPLREQIEVE